MLAAYSVEQVRAAEAELMAKLPEGTLMARAAYGLSVAIADVLRGLPAAAAGSTRPGDGVYGSRVLLLVGSGDNGGDALYAGALLARRGARVGAVLLAATAHEQGLAELRRRGGRVVEVDDITSADWDVVVDGIVGIGGQPGLRDNAVAVLESLDGLPVVAVDVPSGVEVDTGRVDGPFVTADLTVSFGTHKVAHFVAPAAAACGEVRLVDIGLDMYGETPAVVAPSVHDIAGIIPTPLSAAHKYTRGVVGVRAGSTRYPGAALLCVAGASCGLAGMVRYVGPEPVAEMVKSKFPEVVGAGQVQAWAVGSGTAEDAARTLAEALEDGVVPVVIDADALTKVRGPQPVPVVLTPHAGELAKMLGSTRDEVESRQLASVQQAADRFQCVVLLKGPHTLVASPGNPVLVVHAGTPWLATAGAGDVLTGVIAALLAAGVSEVEAAVAGAWLHGDAARRAAGTGPISASDVGRFLPESIAALVPESFPTD